MIFRQPQMVNKDCTIGLKQNHCATIIYAKMPMDENFHKENYA
jgi:hypothetical protein